MRLRAILSVAAALAVVTAGSAHPRPGRIVRVATSLTLDRPVYYDAVHHADFRTSGICIEPHDVVQARVCMAGRTTGTVGSVRLGFEAQRFVEAAPADAPVVQTSTPRGEQLVRLHLNLFDGGAVKVTFTARRANGVTAAPVAGSPTDGGEVHGRSVTWQPAQLEPGEYDFQAAFAVDADPSLVASFVPEIRIERIDNSRAALEYYSGSVRVHEPVERIHTLRLVQHIGRPAAPPRLSAGRAAPDGDAVLPSAWGIMPSFVARGTFYEPTGGLSATRTHRLAALSPGSFGNANAASMGWTYWSPSPGPKIEPVTDFAYRRDGRKLQLAGFDVGIKTAYYLRWEIEPQATNPIYDGDAGSIGVTASAGVVQTRAKRPPSRPGGTLTHDWDGSYGEVWTELVQNSGPGFEPNATAQGPDDFIAPSRSRETGMHVHATGGDIDNRKGKKAIRGEPIVFKGPWAFASIGTGAPAESKYAPRFRFEPDGLTIIPRIGRGGYMLESRPRGWNIDWAAWHSVGSLQLAPNRDGRSMSRTFLFPSSSTGRIDVLSRAGLHRVFEAGPGTWQLLVTPGDIEVTRIDARAPLS